jgi:N-acylglucosamine-6-phosphate 2-epimerase
MSQVFFDALNSPLIVSVQAEAHEPLGQALHLLALCHSVAQGGAAGLRLANLEVMTAMHATLPCIGLLKQTPAHLAQGASLANKVYITPTLATALQVAQTGVAMVAVDATPRPRPDGLTLSQTVQALKAQYPNVLVLGDCDTLASARYAVAAGVDALSTTLAGYTRETLATFDPHTPDWPLLQAMVSAFGSRLPVVAEGRFWHPKDARQALAMGATVVVVGSAITRPNLITQRFVMACTNQANEL